MVSFIAPCYQYLPILLPSLICQTDRNWECLVCHDGDWEPWEWWVKAFADDRIRFRSTAERQGVYGHPIREAMLKTEPLHGRYLVHTNADNYYCPTTVAAINKCSEDVVAFPCVHNYYGYGVLHPKVEMGNIDMGQVAVRTDIATDLGFPWREHGSDFLYFNRVAERTADWRFLSQDAVCVHN